MAPEVEKNQLLQDNRKTDEEVNEKEQTHQQKEIIFKLVFDVIAVEETIVKVIVDAKPPKIFNMKIGDVIAIKAEKKINFLASSATGITASLNKKNIKIEGKTGQYINLYFTAK